MALEFCENGDLSKVLDEYSLLDEKSSKFLIAELILGIKQLHNKGILFRDLKPENILVDCEGHIRLADFGESHIRAHASEGLSYKGTLSYMSPEVYDEKVNKDDSKSDIFSLGVVLYYLINSALPFYGGDHAVRCGILFNEP